jgi:4-hydroxy-tetrahydrodipicolinate reductase
MIKIAISGALGKMGRVINSIIKTRDDCETLCGIDILTESYDGFPIFLSPDKMTERPDVIIDFSSPAALDGLLRYSLSTGVPLVLSTTGYTSEQITRIKKTAEQIPVFFSFNMSLGINLLVSLCKKATEVLGSEFDVEIVEYHHNQKIDSPSGTAIMLADAVCEAKGQDMQYVYDRYARRMKRTKNEIGISAVRGGTIVGEHEVLFCGRDEVISLRHSAHSKEVFAVGAVNAAVFLSDKPAGLYDMSQLIDSKK